MNLPHLILPLSNCGCVNATLSASATHYELTPKALADLDDIWRYSAERWSVDQADLYIDDFTRIFELLVSTPEMARERHEFNPPVHIHSHAQHLVVYTLHDSMVLIIRVLGGKQNWKAILDSADS